VETAVVTGAGRGFGREIALRLAERGYAVLATDVNGTAAEETAGAIGGSAWAMTLDARDPEAHRAAATAATERGELKVWINNAGVARAAKGFDDSDADVRLMVETNLLGVIWGSRAAIDAMRPGGGHIVNIGSMSSLGPVPGITTYAATKHGVLGYTTSLQGDLDTAGVPIRMHVVCPDAADTVMVREVADRPDSALLFTGPRLLEASEVADHVVSLLDGSKLVVVIPRWRGWVIRGAASYPRAGLKGLSVFRRIGERKRRQGQPLA
jgi:NAD(P)-dependent dehydrogenase (short-subunit alcohol dehydrogenase family)